MKFESTPQLVRAGALILFVGLTACGAAGVSGSSLNGEQIRDEGENLDIQVVAANAHGIIGGAGSSFLKDCSLFDKTPSGQPGKFTAKGDCTQVASDLMKLPLFNTYVEPLVWVTESSTGGEPYMNARHWCGETRVVVAVKEAAWNSPNFREIGFYSRESVLNEGTDGVFVSFAKDDPRLHKDGEGILRSGEKVLLFKFAAAGPCEVNGSGNNPSQSLVFKPFVVYEGGLRRWEQVSGNHGVAYGQHWYRNEILQ